jgi:hypothetical protein
MTGKSSRFIFCQYHMAAIGCYLNLIRLFSIYGFS